MRAVTLFSVETVKTCRCGNRVHYVQKRKSQGKGRLMLVCTQCPSKRNAVNVPVRQSRPCHRCQQWQNVVRLIHEAFEGATPMVVCKHCHNGGAAAPPLGLQQVVGRAA